MPRRAPVLTLRIRSKFREIRGERRLLEMERITGIAAPILSELERGSRLPRPRDLEGLEEGYGPQHGWYVVMLEEEE